MSARYRKKPIVIEAIRWDGDNITAVTAFMAPQQPVYVNDLSHMKFTNADDLVGIQTLEGLMVADKGDWIIRGVQGELYPCKPDIFEATYEAVSEPPLIDPDCLDGKHTSCVGCDCSCHEAESEGE